MTLWQMTAKITTTFATYLSVG